MDDKNIWGTCKELINADEFCPDCEREYPYHYNTCPIKNGASK